MPTSSSACWRGSTLTTVTTWISFALDDDMRPGNDRQRELALHRQAQQAPGFAATPPHLRDLDVLARVGTERQLFGGQVAHRVFVGRHRPSQAWQLRQRVGARLHAGGGLANQPIQIGGRRPYIVGRLSAQQKKRERG